MSRVPVIDAIGTVGRQVVADMIDRGTDVLAGTPNPDRAGAHVCDGAVGRPPRDAGTFARDDADRFVPPGEAATPSPPEESPVSDRDTPVSDDVPVTDGGRPADTQRDGRVEPADPPPDALVRVVNPVLKLMLRSPLHPLVSDNLLLLTVTGRKTGTRYTFPVGYEQRDDTLAVISHGTNWWMNLRDGGAEVTVLLRGDRRSGHATVQAEDEAVAEYLHGYFRREGVGSDRRAGLKIEGEAVPDPAALRDVVDHVVVVTIDLEDATG